jgi:DNA-binding LacI/PurR family transcriptional regulator
VARIRMADVAAAAGVSTATVSMVLSGAGGTRITEETSERVREAARAIGYAPNSVARSLRTQRTRMVGLVSDTIATTPFAGGMLAGANAVAREQGHLVVFVNTDDDEAQERTAIDALVGQRVDAIVYARMWHQIVSVPEGLPAETVFLDCRPEGGGAAAVVPDDRQGGVAAVRELLAAGHRRIAYVDAPQDSGVVASQLRYEGYLQVLAEAGIDPDPALTTAWRWASSPSLTVAGCTFRGICRSSATTTSS